MITEKGEKAQELNGHKGYKKWESKKKCVNKLKEWALWATLLFAFVSALYAVLGHYSTGKTNTPQEPKSDTINQQSVTTPIPQPTASSIKDSLKYKDSLAKIETERKKTLKDYTDTTKHK